jgi:hypothetical protein
MKAIRCIFFSLFLAHFLLPAARATTPSEMMMQVGIFYSYLQPYGEWIEFESGFYAWRPAIVHPRWRPYMVGCWVWTDYGWYWVSHEPFGWIVFHYGRWYYDDFYGWLWVPDYVWAPAWVEWRYSGTHVGWAPLPPYARFSVTIGIRFTRRWVAPIHYWNFVEVRRFTYRNLEQHVEPVERTRRLFGYTRSSTRYEVSGDRIINRGFDRTFIERAANTRIERVEVRESRERGERIFLDGRTERLEIFRPDRSEHREIPERIEARRAERRPALDIGRVERTTPDQEYERNRQRPGFEGRSRQMERGEENEATPEMRRDRRERPFPRRDEQVRPGDDSRRQEEPSERRPIFRPREEPRRFSEPRIRREQQPAPPSTGEASRPSRRSGGRRDN